ncbi:MAG: hypothetical protein P1U77_28935, partial [Rubripirellula sp.]|nr:hypothetical protein [Rubripirellula sp.]
MLHTYRVKRYGLRYVRRVTNGMLNTEIYEQIYAKIQRGPDLDFLEVGGAGGAATIAIAWGKRDAGMKSKVIVVEKFEGGSRDRYGTRQTNYERYQKHMRDFKATSYISLFDNYLTFDNATDVLALRTTKKLAGMMLDADGMIHRDFSLFFNELADDALIVIDDYHETKSEKHARTWRLLNQLIDWG